MKIYFVRHGESEANAGRLVQSRETPLSEKGKKQARTLAKRFLNIPIDVIYASPYERARATAETINEVVKKDIKYTELLGEKKQASAIEGRKWGDEDIARIYQIKRDHINDAEYHYLDEESFLDFGDRVGKFFSVLEKEKSENVLIVSHGGPIRTLVYTMMFGRPESKGLFYKFNDFFWLDNTGVTLCERNEDGRYKLVSWNDRSHFAE